MDVRKGSKKHPGGNVNDETTKKTDASNKKWYVKVLPRGPSRSKNAYIRERLNKIENDIDRKLEIELWNTHIGTETLIEAEIGSDNEGALRALSKCAGNNLVGAVIAEMEEETGLVETDEEIGRALTPHAQAHAQAWLEEQAPASHWNTIMRAIRANENDAPRDNGMLSARGSSNKGHPYPKPEETFMPDGECS